jgi:hypothetical protein
MPVSALLLIAAAATGPLSADPSLALATPVVDSTPATQAVASGGRIGIGGNIQGGNNGAGASLRWWVNERAGIDAGAFWYRGRRYETSNGTFERTSAVLFSTTGLALLSPHNRQNEIDLRPIVGAGVNYIRSSQFVVNGELTTDNPRGWGWHALGGVEAAFIQGFALTGAMAYYWLPGDFRDAGLLDGFNLVIGIHAYF